MTVDSIAAPPTGRVAPDRRRLVALVAAAVVVVGAFATLITVRHLDHEYGPIEPGEFAGVYSTRNITLGNTSDRLSEVPGATGELIASLINSGSHSVRVLRIDRDDVVSNVRWSVYRFVPAGNVSGVATRWHSFPVTVPAGATIRLLITIHRPTSCARHRAITAGQVTYAGQHMVHWKSLLHSHTTLFDDGLGLRNIRIC